MSDRCLDTFYVHFINHIIAFTGNNALISAVITGQSPSMNKQSMISFILSTACIQSNVSGSNVNMKFYFIVDINFMDHDSWLKIVN